jgi:hypothetical protein
VTRGALSDERASVEYSLRPACGTRGLQSSQRGRSAVLALLILKFRSFIAFLARQSMALAPQIPRNRNRNLHSR